MIEELKVVHFMGDGIFSFQFLIENIQEVHMNPLWDETWNTFIDFEHVDIPIDSDGLEAYEEFFAAIQVMYGRRKWAIYTHSDQTKKSASLVNVLQATSIGVDIFYDRKDALAFIGVPEEKYYLFGISPE